MATSFPLKTFQLLEMSAANRYNLGSDLAIPMGSSLLAEDALQGK